MTAVILAPYAILVVPMAVFHGNPKTGFILSLLGLALASTLAVELAFRSRIGKRGDWQRGLAQANAGYPHLFLLARLTAVVSIVADVVGALEGRGTVFTQAAGELASSPAAFVTSALSGWRYLAVALLLASLLGGHVGHLRFLLWATLLVATQVVLILITAISAPLIGFLSFLLAVTAICGVVRPRFVIAAVLVLFLVWPTIFAQRNEVRVGGGYAVDERISASDRLRFDLQVSRASDYEVPVDIGRPGLPEIVRYGVVPRILDPDRPALSTGARINEFLGGSPTSAYTFLALGTIYFLDGPWGVILFYSGWALAVVALMRIRGAPGPVRLAYLCFVMATPLVWSATYPESMIAFVQYSVAALPVFLIIHLTRQTRAPVPPAASGYAS
ncbi:hypothetical protein ACGFIK_16715 [Micromonospora sp. NPDC048871]|uniref:hypothetical protein n=1 Tax=Micromonospora sp. NPDC048871 TaxID=3364259 RepID=UPI003711028F